MKTRKPILNYVLVGLITVVSLGVYLNHSYQNSLEDSFLKAFPDNESHTGFTFTSGDKNLTTNEIYPSIIDLSLKPGDIFTGTLVVKNYSDKRQDFTLKNGDKKLVDEFRNDKEWENVESSDIQSPSLTFNHINDFTIPGGGIEIISYSLNVPGDSKEAKYLFKPSVIQNKIKEVGPDDVKGAGVRFFPGVGVLVKVEVSKSPTYYQYQPLITVEPHAVAKDAVLIELRLILATALALFSLLFVFKYFIIK